MMIPQGLQSYDCTTMIVETVGIGPEKMVELLYRRLCRNLPGRESESECFQCCARSVPGPRSCP